MIVIRLNASEIAIITGHNTYQNVNELKDKILIRNGIKQGTLIKNDIQRNLMNITDKDILQNIKKELKLEQTATKKDIEYKLKSLCIKPLLQTETEQESHMTLDTLLDTVPITKKMLKKSAYSDLIKARGNHKESDALNRTEIIKHIRIKKRNNKLYCRTLYSDESCTIILQGKIDGMIDDDVIVETKNRSRRLFYRIPNYEKVQMEAYFYLTNTGKALHVENYNEMTNEQYYYHNETFWSECMQTIIDYIIQNVLTCVVPSVGSTL